MTKTMNGRETYASDYLKGDTDRAVFLGNPLVDHLFTALQSLAAEVWTNRRRMYVTEALLAEKGVTSQMIEKYMPTADEEARWKVERDRMVKTLYAPFLRRADIDYASARAVDYDSALGRAADEPVQKGRS